MIKKRDHQDKFDQENNKSEQNSVIYGWKEENES